jgi:hypothetical protein
MKKVCGLDVHKDSIFCAIYNGESHSEVKEFSTMTPDIYSMGVYYSPFLDNFFTNLS